MKKWIITICVIILILSIILICLYSKKEEINQELGQHFEIEKEYSKVIHAVSDKDNYYAVKKCITKFYLNYSDIYNIENKVKIIDEETKESIKEAKQEAVKATYSMLSPKYLKLNNITEENLAEKLKKQEKSTVDITQMYVSEKDSRMSVYFVKGYLMDESSNSEFYIMIELDANNRTFNVFLEDYISNKYPNIKIGDDINIEFDDQIEQNSYNAYQLDVISEKTYISDMFDNYKNELLFNAELAYSKLDEEYKQKKFGNIDEFKKYLKTNTKNIVVMQPSKFNKAKRDNYTQYICIDNSGKYYIFRETGTMTYTVFLDSYTADLPEFIQKYESATDEGKITLNLQKCFEAINNQDYDYVYKKLDPTFKANNFSNKEVFEKYMKANFFTSNKARANNGKKQGDIYTYDVTISDKTGKDSKTFKKTFVMQLKEGTDFVMSFGI